MRTKTPVISLVHSTPADNNHLFSDGSNFISISGCMFYKHRPMCFIFYSYLFTCSVNTCVHRATCTFSGGHTEHFSPANTKVRDSGSFFLGGKPVTTKKCLGSSFLLPPFRQICTPQDQPPSSHEKVLVSCTSNVLENECILNVNDF